jgi:site-specific recombinase XerD
VDLRNDRHRCRNIIFQDSLANNSTWRFAMFEQLFSSNSTCRRHREAPFYIERERYLRYCAEHGGTRATLRLKANELLWLAQHLGSCASEGVAMDDLRDMARRRQAVYQGATTVRRLIDIGRPWLKFLGWWRTPVAEFRFQRELDQYVAWMRHERGLSRLTVERWRAHARTFLRWCEKTDQWLATLQPSDIDRYFVEEGARRWSRVSVCNTAVALRAFLRYAARSGVCDARLAETILRPRVYRQESVPRGPGWSDVGRILAKTETDEPRDIRNRAILMLLAIYGMRSGEVASLRLDQIDWRSRVLRLFRLKRRQAQVYPLLPSVAEALARYIDTIRPPVPYPEVFIRLQAPRRPIKASSLYDIANREFVALGIRIIHPGPHALRHACAGRLLADGLTLKEIGDHLGHRSTSATRTYAKVDMVSLREVGDFDLGDLQ